MNETTATGEPDEGQGEERAAAISGEPSRLELAPDERRVLGVLIEKGLQTPEYYPMTINAIVAGCNQKSNRDPHMHLDDAQVEAVLTRLQAGALVAQVMPSTGRVPRWRQELGSRYGLRGQELAVLGEFLLRRAQTEGELRTRASRMREIPSLGDLTQILAKLRDHRPPLAVRLTPPGISRGVRWSHACGMAGEREEPAGGDSFAAHGTPPPPAASDRSPLAERIEALERRIAALEARLGG